MDFFPQPSAGGQSPQHWRAGVHHRRREHPRTPSTPAIDQLDDCPPTDSLMDDTAFAASPAPSRTPHGGRAGLASASRGHRLAAMASPMPAPGSSSRADVGGFGLSSPGLGPGLGSGGGMGMGMGMGMGSGTTSTPGAVVGGTVVGAAAAAGGGGGGGSSAVGGSTAAAAYMQWVTIFGFPPERASHVLQRFHECGQIVRHVRGSGNWIHIEYRTAAMANRAHLLDGSELVVGCDDGFSGLSMGLGGRGVTGGAAAAGGTGAVLMVGVKRCPPATVQQLLMAPGATRDPGAVGARAREQPPPPRNLHHPSSYSVTRMPRGNAMRHAKRDNVCSRLMEYMFNW